jgi:hypothetical protein
MRYFEPILILLLLGAAASLSPVSAQPYRAREGVQSGQVRSLGEILNGIRRERPGNLADVQGPNFGPTGDARYRLKWLTPDGRVLWLDTDARTGRVLGVEGDDRGPPRAGLGGFPGRRGTVAPQSLPPGYDQGPPPGYREPPPGYRGPPPGYAGPPPDYNRRPPPGFVGPPPAYGRLSPQDFDRGPPPGYNRGSSDRGSRGDSGRYRYGR